MDTLEAVRTIYSYGLDIYAGFIVGFDTDDADALRRQQQFIIESGIQVAMLNILSAIPKTPLYERLEASGRLIDGDLGQIDTRLGTNFVPAGMEYDELVEGFRQVWHELQSDRAIADRVRNKMPHLTPPRFNEHWPVRHQVRLLARLLRRGIVPGGPRRWYHFARSLPVDTPSKLGQALGDWTRAMALKDYVDRHFAEPAPKMGKLRPGAPGQRAVVEPRLASK